MTSIYLDVCCLNRPFNDQTQDRIRLEAAAILSVLKRIEQNEWLGIISGVVEIEIENDPNVERKVRVQNLARLARKNVAVGPDQSSRALELQALGFGAFDALHVACAEHAGADVLLTVDDRFLRLAIRLHDTLNVRVENPVVWLLEILQR